MHCEASVSLSKSTRAKPGKTKRKLTPEDAFQREWEKVKALQAKTRRMESDIEQLVKDVSAHIEPAERALADTLYLQTEKILAFLERKSLPKWCKYELLDWLESNSELLRKLPFADHLDFDSLLDKIVHNEAIDKLTGADENTYEDPSSWADDSDDLNAAEEEAIEDFFEDLFAELEGQQANIDEEFDAFFDQQSEHWHEQDEPTQQRQNQLDKLLRTSNLNKLFRKIARIIHPDKEQDPEKKNLRHQQMSELLKARDEKDIASLFTLYDEHVGQAPLEELGEDIASATQLLKHQAQQLRDEQKNYLPKSYLETIVLDQFYGKTPQALKTALRKHVAMVQKLTEDQMAICSAMTSIKSIKPLLEERYDSRYFMRFENDIF